VYQFIAKEIEIGRQIYIVYPLVEESEKVDLKAASESFEKLRTEIFTQIPIALLHGRMKSEEKEKVMRQFVTGEIKILVSTTVIEVGVDVPNASVMLIEHAERFGLPQLHQLRGRVGRGKHESYCILLPHLNRSEEAKERLNAMVQIADGFKIAEVDLMLRGPGEFFGTRQHGLPELKYANLITDTAIISEARKAAFQLIDQDPHLRKPEHLNLREKIIKELKQKLPLSYVA
jgi:ATP-dependent DNA helicase RecG